LGLIGRFGQKSSIGVNVGPNLGVWSEKYYRMNCWIGFGSIVRKVVYGEMLGFI